MSARYDRMVKSLAETIKNPRTKRASPYDTVATVKRVEGKTAWVHIPGGVDETPVKLTINASPGDTVQVRIAGGRAWIAGNASAPPTDNTQANYATRLAENAINTADKLTKETIKNFYSVNGRIDGIEGKNIIKEIQRYCLANASSIPSGQIFADIQYSSWSDDIPAYVTGKYFWHRVKYIHADGTTTYSAPWFDGGLQVSEEARIAAGVAATAAETADGIARQALGLAEGTEQHFWCDDSGVHISDREDQDLSLGNSQTISSNGTVIMRNGKLVTSWTGSSSLDAALNFYDCSGASASTNNLMASYTRAGVILYANNKQSLTATPSGVAVYKSDGSTPLASFTGSGIGFADDVPFTIGNNNSFVKWVQENNAWKIKICADEIQMGGKDVMTDAIAVGDNLVNVGIWDSSFATSPIGWTKESDANLSFSFATGLMTISCTSSYYGLYQDIAVKANTKYTVSATVGDSFHIGFGTTNYPTDPGSGWTTAPNGRVYKTFTTDTNTTYRIYVYATNSVPCIVNNIKIEEGGTYTGWASGDSARYMTYVSPTYGIRVYSGVGRPDTYAQMNSNGFSVVESGDTKAVFGSNCTVGSTASSGYNVHVTPSNGIYFRQGTTNLAQVRAVARTGGGSMFSIDVGSTDHMRLGAGDIVLTSHGTSYYPLISGYEDFIYLGIRPNGSSNDTIAFTLDRTNFAAKFTGCDIVLENTKSIKSYRGSGGPVSLLHLTSDDKTVVGYGAYAEYTGETHVYGCDAKLIASHSAQFLLYTQDGTSHGMVQLLEDSDPKIMFRPSADNVIQLGSSSYRWKEVFAGTGSINTNSDLKKKNIINDFDWKIDEFIAGLRPIAYRFKPDADGEHPRIHMGFGAQEVAKLATDLELGDLHLYTARITDPEDVDEYGEQNDRYYHGEEIDDELLTWGLCYNELIAPMIVEIQRLMQRVSELEGRASA